EGGLRAAGLVAVSRPEPRRVRRQDLVAQYELTVREPELELRVGDDDAALSGQGSAVLVHRDGQLLEPLRQTTPHDVGGLLDRDVDVVALGGLGGRGEDRL